MLLYQYRDVQYSKPKKMKKYYQLALALVCLVSVVTLLFYRHEYYRLRYVLEVLNFFGKPSPGAEDCISSNITFRGINKPSFTDPLPSWQRLSDTHYVYSAFWDNSADNHRVHSIAIGQDDLSGKYSCGLWYDILDEPVTGEYSYRKISKHSSKLHQYDMYCTDIKESSGVPYGVTFYKTGEPVMSASFIPVHFFAPTVTNTTALCISPTAKQNLGKSTVVEFLSYHQLIGVTEFIIYNSGSFSRFGSTLTHPTVHDRLGLSLSVLPWNFPFPHSHDIVRSVIETDCLLRTKGKAHTVAVLDWDEYIVPKYHNTLSAMLDDLGKSATMFKLGELLFCMQLPDNTRSKKSDPLFLRKTHYVPSPEKLAYIYQPEQVGGSTQRILPGIAVIHRYVQCTQEQLAAGQEVSETVMFRFSGDLTQLSLLKAWSLGKLFD